MPARTGKPAFPRPRLRGLLAAGVLLIAVPATADPPAPTGPAEADPTRAQVVPIEALVQSIAVWVSSELDLPMPQTLPEVILTTPRSMVEMRYGLAAREELRVVALYHARTGRLFLPDTWTGATPVEVSILVHEMVHHVEAQAGVQFLCAAERERSAYELQERWLDQFGIDILTAFDMTRAGIRRASACYR